MEVGKLKISKEVGKKAQVSLTLSDAVINLDPTEKIPKDHKLDVSVVTKQTLGVFSHITPGSNKDDVIPECEKLFMEGELLTQFSQFKTPITNCLEMAIIFRSYCTETGMSTICRSLLYENEIRIN